MIGVFLIPTGIGCSIGGHNGDATTAANLVASICDRLIVHPNVVNASDLNEMAHNCLYVEGSMIDSMLNGEITLKERRSNKILVAVNGPAPKEIINSINATKYTLGLDVELSELKTPLILKAKFNCDGTAGGDIDGYEEFLDEAKSYQCDAIAVSTPIYTDRSVALGYFSNGGVNPWGGIEAKFSRMASKDLRKPVVHAPHDNDDAIKNFNEVVDARMAPEVVSVSYIHCILKGLQRAPLIGDGISVENIDFMVSPYPCFGIPHKKCLESGIPIIYVKENSTILNMETQGGIIVNNYWEALGYLSCLKIGINPNSVRL